MALMMAEDDFWAKANSECNSSFFLSPLEITSHFPSSLRYKLQDEFTDVVCTEEINTTQLY